MEHVNRLESYHHLRQIGKLEHSNWCTGSGNRWNLMPWLYPSTEQTKKKKAGSQNVNNVIEEWGGVNFLVQNWPSVFFLLNTRNFEVVTNSDRYHPLMVGRGSGLLLYRYLAYLQGQTLQEWSHDLFMKMAAFAQGVVDCWPGDGSTGKAPDVCQ